MTTSLLVCEQTSWWAPALRRLLPPATPVSEVRALSQCWSRLNQSSPWFLVLEASESNLDDLVQRLPTLSQWRHVSAAVVLPHHLRPARWLLREVGARAVASNALELRDIVRISERHAARASSKSPHNSPCETILQQLPWTPSVPS